MLLALAFTYENKEHLSDLKHISPTPKIFGAIICLGVSVWLFLATFTYAFNASSLRIAMMRRTLALSGVFFRAAVR